jgi:RhtB (resistance to homoserine/threonine) family protein
MSAITNYWMFLISGVILNITPGSDTIYILTRSISQGRKAGLYSVLGISTGGMVHTLLASLGLSMILTRSIILFNIIKYVGVAYLVYMGVKAILSKGSVFEEDGNAEKDLSYGQVYRQGLLTNVFNPKVALFFLSFLPQFIDPSAGRSPLPFLILGGTFLTTGTLWSLILAYSAAALSRKLREKPRLGPALQKISGAVFIGLGLKIAFEKK